MYVQTEVTPNPNSLKFLPGKNVSKSGPYEITDKDNFQNDLVRNILSINGVVGIFLGRDFLSVNKNDQVKWEEIKHIVISLINDFYSDGNEFVVDENIKANKEFLNNLGYIPNLFSYPFGEYSEFMRQYISKNFVYAFGQHSGVIDVNKEKFQLPRFPINENYGEIERFTSIIKTYPLEYKKLLPIEKKLKKLNNPPAFSVEFFENQKNIKNINCYSNEGDKWEKSNLTFNGNTLNIKFREAFLPRRGRVNCSLKDNEKWRWFGTQFIISDN